MAMALIDGDVFSPRPNDVEKKIDQVATSPRRLSVEIIKGAPSRRRAAR